jgi:SpoVK/Ycf46/Vps4 family AAA+-type ATPase
MSVFSLLKSVLKFMFSRPAMETLRIYRPRIILHGPVGMGQNYVGPAALHHLEGYHVQSLELGSLMSDSTRVRPPTLFFMYLN